MTSQGTLTRTYFRFVEIPLLLLLLGCFVGFGAAYKGLSTYSYSGDWSSNGTTVNITSMPGERVFVSLAINDQSIEGRWAAPNGLQLTVNGYAAGLALPVVPAKDQDWSDILQTQHGGGESDIEIDGSFVVPAPPDPSVKTLVGFISGDVAFPAQIGTDSDTFDTLTQTVSVAVQITLLSAEEFSQYRLPMYGLGLTFIALLVVGGFLRRRATSVRSSQMNLVTSLVVMGIIAAIVLMILGFVNHGTTGAPTYFLAALMALALPWYVTMLVGYLKQGKQA